MQKLIEGLHRFQSEVFSQQQAFFENLAKGQAPEVLFITCADSRINPNLMTQTAPGEIFIVRNAGGIVPPHSPASGGEQASIEFAVAGLGVKHVVVCGHSDCGAMKGVLEPSKLEDLPSVRSWLGHAEATRRIMKEHYGHLHGDALLTATVEENVLVQMEHLQTHPVIRSRLRNGGLTVHGWVYKMETGKVFEYQPGVGQFVEVPLAIKTEAA